MGAAFEKTGKTSLEMFRQSPDNLRIKLKPLRSEEANRDLLITFQVCWCGSLSAVVWL